MDKTYKKRIADRLLERKLAGKGAVLIEGGLDSEWVGRFVGRHHRSGIILPTHLKNWQYFKGVMAAYGFDIKMSESECVAELFRLYQGMVGNLH